MERLKQWDFHLGCLLGLLIFLVLFPAFTFAIYFTNLGKIQEGGTTFYWFIWFRENIEFKYVILPMFVLYAVMVTSANDKAASKPLFIAMTFLLPIACSCSCIFSYYPLVRWDIPQDKTLDRTNFQDKQFLLLRKSLLLWDLESSYATSSYHLCECDDLLFSCTCEQLKESNFILEADLVINETNQQLQLNFSNSDVYLISIKDCSREEADCDHFYLTRFQEE